MFVGLIACIFTLSTMNQLWNSKNQYDRDADCMRLSKERNSAENNFQHISPIS